MADPTWPVSPFPQSPLEGTWDEQPAPNIISDGNEVGPETTRRRATAKIWTVTPHFFLKGNALYTSFWTFHSVTLADGSLPFTWAHPITGVVYTWMFQPKTIPRLVPLGVGNWRLEAPLVRLP